MKLEDTLKKIFEGMDVLNDESRAKLVETAQQVLADARVEQEKAIRAELSERYAKDKKAIHAAVEQFLEQELTKPVADFKTGIEEVDALKKQYADKVVAVQEQAKKYVQQRLAAVEKVVEGVLKRELTELHESEKTNRRAYLNQLTEAKAQQEQSYEQFRAKAAAVLENIVNVQVQGTLDELREDVKAAREADFGRELFEAFYTTFRRQFFDSSKEFRAVTKQLEEARASEKKLKSVATKKIQEANERARAAEGKAQKVQESVVRARTISKMLQGLTGDTRAKMQHLLEATDTKNLNTTYRKFLPELLNESKKGSNPRSRKAKKIEETVVELQTGGQKLNESAPAKDEDDDEIVNIRRLAGME